MLHGTSRPDPCKEQHALDHFREAARLRLNARAVLLDARRVGDERLGEILGRRPDDRHGCTKLVRNGGDELDLLSRQTFRAIGGDREDRHAAEHQEEHAEAEREIARPRGTDGGLE